MGQRGGVSVLRIKKNRKSITAEKKAHTFKNDLIVNLISKTVICLSKTYEGCKNDKRIADEEAYTFPDRSILVKDKGFQGYEPENVITIQPRKKPRGKELESEDKNFNAKVSSVRAPAEHIIGSIKRLHIVKDVFRNTKKLFADTVMEIACGLHNARLKMKTLSININFNIKIQLAILSFYFR